ncbi:MAG TPA: hypothetical protein VJS44_08470 [Pyrinomonadaceae bacterium]|nr:hypothetical protein [Pyrinomonadaceae bacterium]
MRKLLLALCLLFTVALTTALPPGSVVQPSYAQNSRGARGGNPNVRVWVNTGSGIYWCPGSRWYGKTKEGFYTTQREAQQQGYRAAYYEVCN